jgi:predicted ATPase
MNKLEESFSALPPEFMNVLRSAQEKFDIEITPLQELKGGRTGAFLFLVSVSWLQSNKKVEHLILKLDHKDKKSNMDELERHRSAFNQAPPEFSGNHIACIVFDKVELDGAFAIFYSIAGQSLNNYRSLAGYQQQDMLEKIFKETNNLLLSKWNKNAKFEKVLHPQQIISDWLGYRLKPGGNIETFIEKTCGISQDTKGLMIQGDIFPNPLLYSRNAELWEKVRPIDTIIGFQHGDLNTGNILAKFNEEKNEIEGYYLIDFALFKPGMPLFYDLRYLEVSYLITELPRVSFTKWVDMVTRFSEKDILDPLYVPIELSGTCAVLSTGRKAFGRWIEELYPSLSDDLWGQSWLAAAAAGLNFCNKSSITEKERLAGLIYAAAYLKRYHNVFGVQLPVEVKYLDIRTKTNEAAGSGSLQRSIPEHNLPSESTPFIGRETEMVKTTALIRREDVRLLTLTGPGGTGKTRLALQTARGLINDFKDGVFFVDLSSHHDQESVLASISNTIGIRETSNRQLIDELKSKLQGKKMLLLLDNFEQVINAAPKIGELLLACPHLKLLVTSREALHLRGENIFPVPPLRLPLIDFNLQSVEQLSQFESVRLFIDRALAVKPNFEVTNKNAPAVAEICLRLDGLPLAIELAAARIKVFSPEDLLERMEGRLQMLRGGAADLPIRQKTLRDTINWSYDMLNGYEQKLFSLFSVFSTCTFEAIEKTAGKLKEFSNAESDILDGITSLIDKSLIQRVDRNTGKTRLMMLETIREYASGRLDEDPAFAASVCNAHAVYYADFTHSLQKQLTGGSRESILLEIENDMENMKTSWRYWAAEKNLEQLNKLIDSLWLIFDAKGRYYATLDLTTDLLDVLGSTPSAPERALQEIMLKTSLARVLMSIKGPTPEVEKAYTDALDLCKKYGEIPQSYPVLRALGSFYGYTADFEKSAHYGRKLLDLAEETNNENMKVEAYLLYGYSLAFAGNVKAGMEYLEKGVASYNIDLHGAHKFRIGNNPGITAHTTSALCSWMLGFPEKGLKFANDALFLANKLNHPYSLAYALFHTGLFHLWRQEFTIALERADAALEIARRYEFQIWKAVTTCLHGASLAGIGETEKGLLEIKGGIEMYTELKTPPVFWPTLLMLQADTYVHSGKPKEGLKLINDALEIIERKSGNPILPEIYRLKGDVLIMISPGDQDAAGSWFMKALEISREQETLMFELKAAVSLNRLWKQNGKAQQSRQILNDAYKKFTEGFSTVDLIEAQRVLAEPS